MKELWTEINKLFYMRRITGIFLLDCLLVLILWKIGLTKSIILFIIHGIILFILYMTVCSRPKGVTITPKG